ncbi:outer membrane protein assembly factor BamE [Natronocella acetinitrilica]|uniref:Outer membrane protein assembly factor BamE n=1 Tax=Natronocella acetinitrilica TaxID=414046 RepID=A0AAE3G522_9GAMM|nr:outer membrane protein assembly factor BamE [Natronocella acetinitrilica]MCP1676015.1 outer membrane protein assembly factor BamE [Natronocella acetinitrilica]
MILLTAGALIVTGCSGSSFPYRPEVQQGNIITDEMVEELRPGMSRRQVRFILGSPVIEDMFRNDRWDYIHSSSPGGGGPTERLTLFFDDNDQLVAVEGNLAPENWRGND